jgi:hypothetical protein
MKNVYNQLKSNTIISQYMKPLIVTVLSNTIYLPNQNPPSWQKKHANIIVTY